MAVIIGNARISERGSVVGNRGDQTGREVMTQPWSTGGPWQHVIRPKSANVARKIAEAMRQACANNNIGYDQPDRASLYKACVANGWHIDRVGPCNTDCSALVSVCVNYAGIKVSPQMYTGNELTVLGNTGQFTILSGSSYTHSEKKLMAGDILLRAGHTAVVVSGAVPLPEDKQEDEKPEQKARGEEMQCTYQIDDKSTVYWFDGQRIHKLNHPDQLRVIKTIYKANNDRDMPHFKWTSKAPWFTRLKQALKL